MQRSHLKHACSLSLALAMVLPASPGWAQWAWRDANGSVQYSDTPPPSSVPQHRILKQPGLAADASSAPAPDSAPASPAAQEAATPSWVEQNAEFMKRREERLEQEKKEKEERLAAAEHAKNCTLARENLRMLEGGRPILQPSANGGAEYLSDNERAAEMKKMRDYLKECR